MTERRSSARLSRRHVLAGLGVGLTATSAVAAPALGLGSSGKATPPDSWLGGRFTALQHARMEEWARHVGGDFTLAADGGKFSARLVEVKPLGSRGKRHPSLRDQAFTVVFEAKSGSLPPGNSIYPVAGPKGELQIFFTGCGPACGGRRLQAVFG